ncbi:MAG: thioether cross-link-forming SCIFF peptide maturase, partial [Firmicutes bacterium]|nr:thioether cross-link-forming SCIFF peptide maturase [Bacillota bacterium]
MHAYELHGSHIVLDVNSGSVHVTDPAAFYAITHWGLPPEALAEKFPGEDLGGLFGDIQKLIEQEKLFSPEIPLPPAPSSLPPVKALCLHVSHTCNLTCDYCFAQAGKYHGAEALMPFEVGRQALDFLLEHSGARRNLEVDFFGGEPLMNWQAVKALVAYARSKEREFHKNFRFTLTTNGVLVDGDVIAFANQEMSNVVLSLDGRKEIHDRLRRTVNGKGSYDLVVPKFQAFARARGEKNYYIRGTFTHFNPDFTRDLYHMASLGFRALSMEPVVCAPGSPYALTPEDIETVKSEYEALALEMARRRGAPDEFSFYHYNLDLKHGPCIHKRAAGCGSGRDYLAVTPTGELYPCHQFVGDPAFRMGDVRQGVTRPDIREAFAACTLNARPACHDCWAKYYCAGGCAANAYHAGGSIGGVYPAGCELFKKRMECAIWLATQEKS